MEQILIIEDDFSLNQGLCRALKQEERQQRSPEAARLPALT